MGESSHTPTYAAIFAGGVGRRMGASGVPKQFLCSGGKPIILHTLEKFERHPQVDGIAVACVEGWIDELWDIIADAHLKKVLAVVPGGRTGQESIRHALAPLVEQADGEDAVVLVHDGVRPLIDADLISACIRSVEQNGSGITVAPATETVVLTGDEREASDIIDRSKCVLARAPQTFWLQRLWKAHEQARCEGLDDFIDSASLMAHYGEKLFLVEGPSRNIKITTPEDYFAFKGLIDMGETGRLWSDRC